MGYSSPTIHQLRDKLLTRDDISWYGSLAVLGATLGGFICQVLTNKYGRKCTMLMCSLPYAIGWLSIVAAQNKLMLYIGRVITGLSFGMTIPITSIYISEVASANTRGMLAMLNNILQMVGLVLVYGLGLILSWRWLAVIPIIVTLLTVFLIAWLPESPRHLLLRFQNTEAKESLMWLGRSENECEKELETIRQSLCDERNDIDSSFKSEFCVNLILLIILMIFSEGTGTIAIFFYGELILTEAGDIEEAEGTQVILAVFRVVCSLLGGTLVDRLGRKGLLITSGIFMMLGNLSMGGYLYVHQHYDWQSQWLPISSLLVSMAAYSIGWGPIPWIYQSELFDVKTRGISATVASLTAWTSAFLVSRMFLPLQTLLNPYGVFWLFSGVCLLSPFFVAVCLPETKQKPLEHITKSEEDDPGCNVEWSRL